jgi:hypothetical protein
MDKLIACKTWLVEHGVRHGLVMVIMALSFSHIHDLALHNGQAPWQADLYPATIDAVQAYALHKLRTPGLDALATAISWCVFLLFCGISLAANLLDAPVHNLTGYFTAILPAAGLVVVTALGHLHPAPAPQDPSHKAPESKAPPAPQRPKAKASGAAPTGKRERARAIITAALAEFHRQHPQGGTYKELAEIANEMLLRDGLDERSPRTYSNILAAARA